MEKADKKKGAGGKKSSSGAFSKPCKLSNELAVLMGTDMMPRSQVVSKIWAIIKERNLYDPTNKQFAICDEDLKKVFKCDRFRIFGMMKYLKNHISNA